MHTKRAIEQELSVPQFGALDFTERNNLPNKRYPAQRQSSDDAGIANYLRTYFLNLCGPTSAA